MINSDFNAKKSTKATKSKADQDNNPLIVQVYSSAIPCWALKSKAEALKGLQDFAKKKPSDLKL